MLPDCRIVSGGRSRCSRRMVAFARGSPPGTVSFDTYRGDCVNGDAGALQHGFGSAIPMANRSNTEGAAKRP